VVIVAVLAVSAARRVDIEAVVQLMKMITEKVEWLVRWTAFLVRCG
jgi:hypothetical protein